MPAISVVIPVYNEEAILESSALELSGALSARKWDYEIIFAENGSTDGTRLVLEKLTRSDPRLRWFHSERPNYGHALREGILRAQGDVVLCDEIDLCDPGFYDRALPLLADGVDLVVGSKAAPGAQDHRPLVRRMATRAHNGLLRLALGFKGTDTHGLKAFRRQALLPVIEQCIVDMDVFASEFVVRAWRQGLRVQEVPITLHEKRQPSIHLFKRVPNVLKNVGKLVVAIRFKGQ